MEQISTPRLSLRLMTVEFLEASLQGDRERAEALLGLKVSPDWFRERDLMKIRLDDCRAGPAYAPFSLRGIGLVSSGAMVGHIGFHTRPDPAYLRPFAANGIEFGYTVYPAYRRQGYALEASIGMMRWAAREHAVERFVASVAPTNSASTALVKKLGFVRVGEHDDEVDGLEYVYVLEGEPLRLVLVDGR